MKKRQWDARTKALIVKGLKGKPVAELCREHQISQSLDSQWRDQFLANAATAVEVHQHTRKAARLEQENAQLNKLVGELTLELKKRRAVRMTRRRSLRGLQRDDRLLPRIQALKAEPPCWGYRRSWAYLRFVAQRAVNTKCIWRLMREHHLLVQSNLRLKAKRTPTRSKPRLTNPNEWWGIDLTKGLVQGLGWVYIVVVLDWSTKMVVGDYAGSQCTAWPLAALDMAVNQQFPNGARDQGLSLMSDNGCQPTAVAFLQACQLLGIQQAFTSFHNPKGNADTERFMRTLKEECLWLQEWTSPCGLISTLDGWLKTYNDHDLHSALGYTSPRQFAREHHHSHSTPFVAT